MTNDVAVLPPVVSREEWTAARKELLAAEKAATRARDALNARRRTLPMVEVDKEYVFRGPAGEVTLGGLFEGRRQLIVYHFMFDPAWDEGCHGCSHFADNVGNLAHLHARETTLVFVSRAPLEKIRAFRERMGWTVPWVSSLGSDFNYDFHVTLDESVAPVEYNYRDRAELEARGLAYALEGEQPGLSVFLREGGRVFHTYSAFARGLEDNMGTFRFLDLTPFGRGEGWDGMPDLSGQGMAWLRHHDRYEPSAPASAAAAAGCECCHAPQPA